MKQQTILLVDDNPAEIELFREALLEVNPKLHLLTATGGDDCLILLRQIEDRTDATEPDLILLDLNMPGPDGRSILGRIKGSRQLRHLPVIILSTSKEEKDVLETYRLQANSYVAKPLGFEELKTLLRNLLHYWLQVARIPSAG